MPIRLSRATARNLGLIGSGRPRRTKPTVEPSMTVLLSIPLKVNASLNLREHWAVRSRRVTNEKKVVRAWLGTMLGWSPPTGYGKCKVRLVRLGGQKMDDDNLEGVFKAVRDAIAEWFDQDDGSDFFEWSYHQETGGPVGIRVELSR